MVRFIIALIVLFSLAGAELPAQPNDRTLWTDKNGLSNNIVTSLIKDKQGFLWLGTFYGLNRFDGKDFEVFIHTDDPKSIQSNFLAKMLLITSGQIVIGYVNGGVSFFDPAKKEFKNFLPGTSNLPSGAITSIYETTDNQLLVGVERHGLYCFNGDDNNFEHIFDNDLLIRTICEINGLIWLGTTNGLYSWDKKTKALNVIANSHNSSYPYLTMIYDQQSKIWLGSWTGGVESYDVQTKEWQRYLYSKPCEEHCLMNIVSDLEFESKDILLVGTYDKGICRFNTTTKEFQVSNDFDVVQDVLVDDHKTIWIASSGGLTRIDPLISQIKYSQTIKRTSVFHYDKLSNSLIVGTLWGEGLKIVDLKTNEVKTVPIPFPSQSRDHSNLVLSIEQRTNGDIYIQTKDYICRLDRAHLKLVPIQVDLDFIGFGHMTQDSKGNLWITSAGKRTIAKINIKDSVSFYHVKFRYTCISAYQNQVWFGGPNGVANYDLEKDKFNFWSNEERNSVLPKTFIRDILSIKGVIWIATDNGLYKMQLTDDEKLLCHELDKSQGLSTQPILCLTSDDNDNVWFSNNSYIGRVDSQEKATLFSFTANPTDSKTNYYSLSTVKIGNTCKIYISDYKGAYEFEPKNLRASTEYPRFFIKESAIPGTVLSSNINLSQNQKGVKGNNLNILFGAIYFGDWTKIRYAYRVVELDNDWIYNDSRNFYINYNNLPSDRPLTLQVKISNQYNSWSEPAVIKFEIPSPLWQRGWFIISSVLGFLTLVWKGAKWYVDSAKKKNEKKLELEKKIYQSEIKALRSQMNPHFIFNCLSTIQDQVFAGQSTEATKYIADFGLLLRKTLNNSDRPLIKLKEEISTIELYIKMEALRFKDQFAWEIKLDPEIDLESVEFPPMLIQPVVENAIHYGLLTKVGERNLLVHFFEAGNQLVCRIEDNGVGLISHRRTSIKNPERASKGTSLISDRIALLNQAYSLNGSLQMKDISEIEPDKTGTRVELSFDLAALET